MGEYKFCRRRWIPGRGSSQVPQFRLGKHLLPHCLSRYYTNALNRGYLAEAAEIQEARQRLGLVMGYKVPERKEHLEEKGPTQVFYGIPPGALVSLVDKKVFLPTNPIVKDYYQKDFVADKQFP
ncbi:hypothetical protein OESDEN_12170 [Oesophagostomum dentatum]|uniref:39S ribosomal protein L15, mitochondrial n=1 Tax=Oesophagostomum dentatum TaxID=61180 RepID=A0A0B1SXX7_OESDE|nr:hypothetical protein OESDEN_12170 [Oesophagostomum dentatum]